MKIHENYHTENTRTRQFEMKMKRLMMYSDIGKRHGILESSQLASYDEDEYVRELNNRFDRSLFPSKEEWGIQLLLCMIVLKLDHYNYTIYENVKIGLISHLIESKLTVPKSNEAIKLIDKIEALEVIIHSYVYKREWKIKSEKEQKVLLWYLGEDLTIDKLCVFLQFGLYCFGISKDNKKLYEFYRKVFDENTLDLNIVKNNGLYTHHELKR